MKVKELIEKLEQLNQELEVVVDGYESGFDFVKDIKQVRAFAPEDSFNKAIYDGELFCVGKNDSPVFFTQNEKIQGKIIDVVYIPRTSY